VGQGIAFAEVTVIEAAKLNTPAADLLRRLMDWMQLQRNRPQIEKGPPVRSLDRIRRAAHDPDVRYCLQGRL